MPGDEGQIEVGGGVERTYCIARSKRQSAGMPVTYLLELDPDAADSPLMDKTTTSAQEFGGRIPSPPFDIRQVVARVQLDSRAIGVESSRRRVDHASECVRDVCGAGCAQLCFVVPGATDTPSQVIELINLYVNARHS